MDESQGRVQTFYGPLLLYIAGLNVLAIAAVALLHELGHAALGHWMGCGNIEVVLFNMDVQSTFSRMTCSPANQPDPAVMVMSSFIFLLPLSVLFVVSHGFTERYIGHIVFGIAVIMAATDISVLVGAWPVKGIVALIGAVIALYGEDRLINGIIATEIRPDQPYR